MQGAEVQVVLDMLSNFEQTSPVRYYVFIYILPAVIVLTVPHMNENQVATYDVSDAIQ